ncbi:SCO2322 family protein [Demetria terragena]|uniref:SCO2322 family protein n=1 Tax=Demetria terragena TaxID=63959 RepID=UPI0003760171|nr:SCO2322 family protein [Demetria terragena]
MTIVHRVATRTAAAFAAFLGAMLFALSVAPTADAASAYRFWGYFQLKDGAWAFSTKGPDQVKPADGSVEGWRYALAGPTDSRAPRDTVSFKEACAGTPAKEGTKRVGVVIDYGRTADAESGTPPKPVAECAQVPAAANGSQVLAAVTDAVRVEKGLTCGVDDWPAKGCGGEVKTVPAAAKAKDKPVSITAPAAKETDEDSSSAPILIGGGVVLVLLLGGGAAVAMRRRQSAESA